MGGRQVPGWHGILRAEEEREVIFKNCKPVKSGSGGAIKTSCFGERKPMDISDDVLYQGTKRYLWP